MHLRPFLQRRPFFIDLKSQKKTPAKSRCFIRKYFLRILSQNGLKKRARPFALRIFKNLCACSFLFHFSVYHKKDFIRNRFCESHFVGNDCHGHILISSCWMVFKTSPVSSGSSAEVGSSKSMISGFMASARAMATRCFCPPERLPG